MEGKISENHLKRDACIYVRQSTFAQLKKNTESKKLQYSLDKRANQLGWSNIRVIDEDLGKTGSGCVRRSGYEDLLVNVCNGEIGAVFAFDASRLARNGKEWHTLLEMCGLTETLIVDFEGIYDPRLANDRLLLGMKGTMSEMELNTLRLRSQEAQKQKAARGELFTNVAIGYVRVGKNGIEKDPNMRVQKAIGMIFDKFRELQSVRQVLIWFRQEKVKLPFAEYGEFGRKCIWKLPNNSSLMSIMKNPVYAGAYARGRTKTKITLENGAKKKTRGIRMEQSEWDVLIRDHHDSYITWDEYQRNQDIIAQNANMRGAIVRGSAKKGNALLAGLLRCGHCGRNLAVHYSGKKGDYTSYHCAGASNHYGGAKCISVGGYADMAVSEAVLNILSPLGAGAISRAIEAMRGNEAELIRHKELELEEARYEAERARRQYDRVEPENRNVASELERRWNESLRLADTIEKDLNEIRKSHTKDTQLDEERIIALGENIRQVWDHPQSDPSIKKRIIRIVIKEIIASIDNNTIKLVIHWDGGDHSEVAFPKKGAGNKRPKTDVESEIIISELARYQCDDKIASLLNLLEKKTAMGHTWTRTRVTSFRNKHGILVFREGEIKERGEILVEGAAEILKVSKREVYDLISRKILPASQVCARAPWIMRENDVKRVQKLMRNGGKGPLRDSGKQNLLCFADS